jgi:L-gulonolactone oxidase
MARLFAGQMSHGEIVDRSFRLFANERRIRFTEMEYAIPREHGPEAVSRVLDLVRERSLPVGFPIEFRVVAPDDALLSPAHERDTAYVAVHQYQGADWRPYFEAVEAIMDSYGGRPHWGKRHFQTAQTLAGRYPRWRDFQAVRDRLDPGRAFSNAYTDRVLGP